MKANSRRIVVPFAIVAMTFAAISLGVKDNGQAQFSETPRTDLRRLLGNQNLKGSYSFSLHGFLGKSSCKPIGVTGVLSFDGSGNVTGGSMTMRIQDQKPWSMTIQKSSSYTIKPDGTGAMNLWFLSSVSGKGRWELAIAVGKNGDRVFLNLTKAIYDIGLAETPDEGDVGTGEAVPQ